MSVLYLASEQIIHYDNKFTRRFTHFPATKTKEKELQRETYYISGISIGTIYLGGGQTQLHVLGLDSLLLTSKNHYKTESKRLAIPLICIYDVSSFSEDTLAEVLHTHPYVIKNGKVIKNPHYLTF